MSDASATGMPRVADIVAATANFYAVTAAEIKGPRRQKHLMRARQVTAWLARRLTNQSLPVIGRTLGNRDHSTVLHACRSVDALLAVDSNMREEITTIASRLGCPPAAPDAMAGESASSPLTPARRDVVAAAIAFVRACEALLEPDQTDLEHLRVKQVEAYRQLVSAVATLEDAAAVLWLKPSSPTPERKLEDA